MQESKYFKGARSFMKDENVIEDGNIKPKKKKEKKTTRQKIGVACMIAGVVCILYFLWINFYGVIYHEVYSFMYDHFWEDTFDETTVIFDIGDMPDWMILGADLVPVKDAPVLEGEQPETSEAVPAVNITEEKPYETTSEEETSETETETKVQSNIKAERIKTPLVMPKVYSREEYKNGYMIIFVPRLGVYASVQNGTDEYALGRGPGLYDISDLPSNDLSEDLNVIVAAHRNGVKANFYNLHKMKEGDLIYLYINNFCYIYEYEETKIVEKNDWSVTERRGYGAVTLTSCHPIGDNTHRIIVFGKLADVKVYEPLV